MVPVFTPYIEIPQLRRYQFDVTEISADQMTADGLHTWQYKDEDIDKLKDTRIKALFITNPSNPPSSMEMISLLTCKSHIIRWM